MSAHAHLSPGRGHSVCAASLPEREKDSVIRELRDAVDGLMAAAGGEPDDDSPESIVAFDRAVLALTHSRKVVPQRSVRA